MKRECFHQLVVEISPDSKGGIVFLDGLLIRLLCSLSTQSLRFGKQLLSGDTASICISRGVQLLKLCFVATGQLRRS
jgi:hypothetical protein